MARQGGVFGRPLGVAFVLAVGVALALTALALTLPSAAGAATPPALDAAKNGPPKIIADNGFRPRSDGYSFANYSDSLPSGEVARDLTPTEMQRLFGPRVCAHFDSDGNCVLLPTAQKWMASTNKEMAGGHCMGFAVTSQLFFEGRVPPPPPAFGSSTVPGLGVEGNDELQSHIAYGWAFQVLKSVDKATLTGKPSKVLAGLFRSLRAGTARQVLTIFDDGAGHAITPYAISRLGDGRFRILVYDNNHPDKTRVVRVDVRRETWVYDLGFKQDGKEVIWGGDAKTKSMKLISTRLGVRRQNCFFCNNDAAAGGGDRSAPMELRWAGDPKTGRHGSLFIRDRQGRRSGCGERGCINRIPGVTRQEIRNGQVQPWTLTPPPIFRLPGGRPYVVSLAGAPLRRPAKESVELIGRGFTLGARGIRLRKGETDRLRISRSGQAITFVNDEHESETPTISMSTVTPGADYSFAIKARNVREGALVRFAIKPDRNRLVIDAVDRRGRGSFDLRMTRTTSSGRETFTDSIRIGAGKRVIINYGRWTDDDEDIPARRR